MRYHTTTCAASAGLLALALLSLSLGCTHSRLVQKSETDVSLVVRAAPASLAIMPLYSVSAEMGLDQTVRQALARALEPLSYEKTPQEKTDEIVRQACAHLGRAPHQVPPTSFRRLNLADTLLYPEIVRADKAWWPLRCHSQLRLRLTWIETRSGGVMYHSDLIQHRWFWGIPLSLTELGRWFSFTPWPLREDEIRLLADEAGAALAADFPEVKTLAAQQAEKGFAPQDLFVPVPEITTGTFTCENAEGQLVQIPWRDIEKTPLPAMRSQSRFWFELEFDRPAYLYVFQYDTELNLNCLFPNLRYAPDLDNPLPPSVRHEIPPEGAYSLTGVHRRPIREALFVVVSAVERRDLLDRYEDFLVRSEMASKDEIIRGMDSVVNRLLDALPGNRIYMLGFEHRPDMRR